TTAVDAAKGTVVGSIPLGGKPEFAVSDGRGRGFVNIEDKAELVAFDPVKLQVQQRWSLAPCEEPTGLALDDKHRRLVSGCSNQLMAITDADSGHQITTLPIGDGVDGVAFNPESGLAFASCGDGHLTVVREDSPDRFSVVENVPTKRGARTLALDVNHGLIY